MPNLLRQESQSVKNVSDVSAVTGKKNNENVENVSEIPPEVVFSDIFEIALADRTKVRGCFALWKRTRHILSLAFDSRMQADLVVSTIEQMQFEVPGSIFHSDQGSQ